MNSSKYYLVIDLEATCDDTGSIPREQTEIIEIGAVLVEGETLAPREEWQTFVRPRRHVRLTPFCTRLTSITQEQVDGAPSFPEAIAALGRFLASREALFCSWGDYDRNQFNREATRDGLTLPLGTGHLNVKQTFRERTGDDRRLGVGAALKRVNLAFLGTAHRGIDDARNIARLLPYALGRVPIPSREKRAV